MAAVIKHSNDRKNDNDLVLVLRNLPLFAQAQNPKATKLKPCSEAQTSHHGSRSHPRLEGTVTAGSANEQNAAIQLLAEC